MLECTTCGHEHMYPDGTYAPCTHPDCQGHAVGGKCWITVPD